MKIAQKILLATIALTSLKASAIIVSNYTTAQTDTVLESNGFDWDGVYNVNNCSGVAVGEHWLLTAAHVADDVTSGTVKIGSTTYSGVSTSYQTDGADLALIYVSDVTFDTYYDITSCSLNDTAIMVGYGNTGTVTTATFTDSGLGKGTKRWGTNKITFTDQTIDTAGTSYSSTGVYMQFNSSPSPTSTTYEAGVGTGDSGGGLFVMDENGSWSLAGILNTSASDGTNDYVGAVQLSEYSDWITTTMDTIAIPEPATLTIFGTGFFGLIGYRRRREWLGGLNGLRKSKSRRQPTGLRAETGSQLEPILLKLASGRAAAPQTAPKADPIGDLIMKIDGRLRRR